MVGIKLAGILDIVPDPVDHGPQFITDQLIVMNGVMFTAPFNPPVMTTGIPAANDPANRNAGLCNILGKRRRDITDRRTSILGIKEKCTAQRDLISYLWCP